MPMRLMPAIAADGYFVNLFRAIFFSAEIRKGIFRIRAIYDKIFNNTNHHIDHNTAERRNLFKLLQSSVNRDLN
jgi:hypothetical protein